MKIELDFTRTDAEDIVKGLNAVQTSFLIEKIRNIVIEKLALADQLGKSGPLWADGVSCTEDGCSHSSSVHSANGVCSSDGCPCIKFKL